MRTLTLSLITLSFLFIASCPRTTKSNTQDQTSTAKIQVSSVNKDVETNIQPANITLIKEDITDAPIKSQVVQHYLIASKMSEDELKDLLEVKLSEESKRSGFKYRSCPSHIYIYLYTSREFYDGGAGQYIARAELIEGDMRIKVNKKQLNASNTTQEMKYGYTEQERKNIYKESWQIEDRSYAEAEAKYPLPDILDPSWSEARANAQLQRQMEYQEKVYARYRKELASKYKLSLEQLAAIDDEGIKKDWPIPPM